MKKIKFLKLLVELAIIGLLMFFAFYMFKLNPWMYKFNELSGRLPQDQGFDKIRVVMRFLPILASIKIIIPMLFYITVLFVFRKVLISIIKESMFAIKQVMLIRKIAVIYLVFTLMLFSFNLLRSIFAIANGKSEIALKVIISSLAGSLGYLMTSLIAYIIAEIFLAGFKLREESELTI